MGAKNPVRVFGYVIRAAAETIGEMHERRWLVMSTCEHCRLEMAASLSDLIKPCGPDLVLWDARPRCRRLGCPGRVRFSAAAGPGLPFKVLVGEKLGGYR